MNSETTIYVHPDGLTDVTKPGGTIDNPYSANYLSGGWNRTGYEIVLLNGKHTLSGPINVYSEDPKRPVVIRAANRWQASLQSQEDGKYFFQMTGRNVHLKDMVLEDATVTDRHIEEESPDTDIAGYPSFEAEGQRISSCLIGNLKMGIGFWSNARSFVCEGNIICYIGFWDDTSGRKEGTRGHAIYGQTGSKDGAAIVSNVIFGSLNHGIHCYSQSEEKLDYLRLNGNIIFGCKHREVLVGGTVDFRHLVFGDNVIYDGSCQIGYRSNKVGEFIDINHNDFLDCAPTFVNLEQVNMHNNTFVPKSGSVVFNTLVPEEEQRFDQVGWSYQDNKAYLKDRRITKATIGRQVQNGGTIRQNTDKMTTVFIDEVLSKYYYRRINDNLVYFAYYHSEPREYTDFQFEEGLGEVMVSNVLQPLNNWKAKIVPKSSYRYLNSPFIESGFLGGNIDDLLPDPKRFGVLIFQKVVNQDIPAPEPDPTPGEDPKPFPGGINDVFNKFSDMFASVATVTATIADNFTELSEMSEKMSEYFKDQTDHHGPEKEQ